jgi:hypothetical protein
MVKLDDVKRNKVKYTNMIKIEKNDR